MNLDKTKIGYFLSRKKLWDVPLRKWNTDDLEHFAEAILEASEVNDGMTIPYIDDGRLIIPFTAPHKYRYWMGGQSLVETMIEIGASEEIASRYLHAEGMKLFKENNRTND
jgi:hypothetical protein